VPYAAAGRFAYTADDDSVTGVTSEIMRAFARWVSQRHGVAVTLHFVEEEEEDWRVCYGRVRDAHGGAFGLGNVSITYCDDVSSASRRRGRWRRRGCVPLLRPGPAHSRNSRCAAAIAGAQPQ
jgi:hypothetical protein